jgi:hypothetical protein
VVITDQLVASGRSSSSRNNGNDLVRAFEHTYPASMA